MPTNPLGKVLGDNVIDGQTPVPLRIVVSNPPGDALTISNAAFDPLVVGLNRARIVQPLPPLREDPAQLSVTIANCVGFAPPIDVVRFPDAC